MRAGAAHLELVRQSVTTAATLAHERTLPVVEGLAPLVPSGCVQRGSTIAVHGVGATSFALALAGEAVRDGSFLAVIAPSSFGLSACLDFDIPLRRVVQFVIPDEVQRGQYAQAVAAIIEGFDVVMLVEDRKMGTSATRQLTARNRERGSVLVRVGGAAWPDAADLRFDLSGPTWSGLGQGHGHLVTRQISVKAAGRRHHGAPRLHSVLLPAAAGGVEVGGVGVGAVGVGGVGVGGVGVGGVGVGGVGVGAVGVDAVGVGGVAEPRFAGSDIDALLDAVEDKGEGDGGLDAIA